MGAQGRLARYVVMLDVREGGCLSLPSAAAPDTGAAGEPRWRIRCPEGLRTAQWDDEAVLFNPLSWQTHFVNGPALRVLEELRAGPLTASELVAALYGPDADDPTGVSRENKVMVELLNELLMLGLLSVEPSP
jgi:PqqD family protein of HPr-rel-A system